MGCSSAQMATVSAVYTQSEILQKEVFLVEFLDSGEPSPGQESLMHMKVRKAEASPLHKSEPV